MDVRISELSWQSTTPADDKHSIIDDNVNFIGIHAWKRDQDEQLLFGLQHIDRRLPTCFASRRTQIEELLMETFRARKSLNRLGKHPVDRSFGRHFTVSRGYGWSSADACSTTSERSAQHSLSQKLEEASNGMPR